MAELPGAFEVGVGLSGVILVEGEEASEGPAGGFLRGIGESETLFSGLFGDGAVGGERVVGLRENHATGGDEVAERFFVLETSSGGDHAAFDIDGEEFAVHEGEVVIVPFEVAATGGCGDADGLFPGGLSVGECESFEEIAGDDEDSSAMFSGDEEAAFAGDFPEEFSGPDLVAAKELGFERCVEDPIASKLEIRIDPAMNDGEIVVVSEKLAVGAIGGGRGFGSEERVGGSGGPEDGARGEIDGDKGVESGGAEENAIGGDGGESLVASGGFGVGNLGDGEEDLAPERISRGGIEREEMDFALML